MATKSMMVYLHHPRTNKALQMILTDQYINTGKFVMVQTVGGQQEVGEMKQKLMEQTNNSSVS